MVPIMATCIVDSSLGDITDRSANKEGLHSARTVGLDRHDYLFSLLAFCLDSLLHLHVINNAHNYALPRKTQTSLC
jgi:hypothetical protein